jgi:hypothetical protein
MVGDTMESGIPRWHTRTTAGKLTVAQEAIQLGASTNPATTGKKLLTKQGRKSRLEVTDPK